MGRGVVVVVGVGGDTIEVGGMSSLPALGEQTEILQYVVLGVSSNPGTASRVSTERHLGRFLPDVPNVVVYRLHHAMLGLLNGNIETLGLAVARQSGRSMAEGAVGVHPNCRRLALARGARCPRPVYSGIHLSGEFPDGTPAGCIQGTGRQVVGIIVQRDQDGPSTTSTMVILPRDPQIMGLAGRRVGGLGLLGCRGGKREGWREVRKAVMKLT